MRKGKRSDGWKRWVIAATVPLLMGGCPDLRDEVVGAFETAVRSVVNAALDELFAEFRSGSGGA